MLAVLAGLAAVAAVLGARRPLVAERAVPCRHVQFAGGWRFFTARPAIRPPLPVPCLAPAGRGSCGHRMGVDGRVAPQTVAVHASS